MNQKSSSPTGAPRDVVHIRLGSLVLVFCFAVGAISAITHIWWLTALAVVAAAAMAFDIWRIVRRRPRDDAP